MRIGIVGAGVAGLVCAASLRAQAHTLHHQSRRDDDRDAILNPTGCRPHPRRRRHSSGRRYRRPDRVSVQRPTPARRLDVKKQLVESQIML